MDVAETEEPARGAALASVAAGLAAQPSPLAQASSTPPSSRPAVLEAPLTRLGVGMWASRRHRECQLLLMPGEQQLVVLCDRRTAAPPRSPSRFALAVGPLAAKSPFASGHSAYRAAGCVHAFEVPFAAIRGIDYQNPLCHEARLVLEVVGLRKREFPSMEAARGYFLEPASRPPHGSPEIAARRNTTCGSSGSGDSGLLQAALQAQTDVAGALGIAGAPTAVAARTAKGEAHGSRPAADGGSSSGARGNLLLRLENSSSNTARPQQQPSQPVPISGAGRVPARVSGLAASPCSSFGSYESDPGSPASGSLWYWGSPAGLAQGGSGRLSTAALRGAGTKRRSVRGSSDSYEGREDVGACGGGNARVGVLAAAPPSAACGPRPSSQQQQPGEPWQSSREPQQAQQTPLLHVGSAPSTSLLSSPPRCGPLAWPGVSPEGGSARGGGALHRVASDGQLLGKAGCQVASQTRAASAEPPSERGWPAAHAFTAVSRSYKYRTVVLHWADPRLPGMLRPIIQGNERLLRLHESGLPAWAVYAPQYGLYYRPWLRTITWLLFYAFSAFSFAVGFYDLYKSIPGLQLVMQRLTASVWLPPAAVLEWLEQHTQIRLSILLTYLFGKSEVFVWFMRWAQHFARLAHAAVQPVTDVLGPPAAALGQALSAVGLTIAAILQAALGPIAALLLQLWATVGGALLPMAQLLRSVVAGPFLLLGSGVRQLAGAAGAAWAVASDGAAGLTAGAAALGGTARAGRAVGGATSHALADQALWLYIIPADALEVLRTSAVKAAKAAQAVAKFFLQMCDNVVRHRLTLGLRAGRAWSRVRAWLRAAARTPQALLQALRHWLLAALRLLITPDRLQTAPQPAAQAFKGRASNSPQMQPDAHRRQQQHQQQAEQEEVGAGGSSLRRRHAAASAGGSWLLGQGQAALPATLDDRVDTH